MIHVIKGNIVELDVDAIVNAANSQLLPGGGVCGAIHKAAGSDLLLECLKIAPCPTGSAVLTKGYGLKARYVIHAVGPVYIQNLKEAPALLKSAYVKTLKIAHEHQMSSIAFPCIGTGIYGYPNQRAAEIAILAAKEFLASHQMNITFCCFLDEDFKIYQGLI